MKITDQFLKRLKAPANGRVTYSDESVPGFGIRVSASGVKSFTLLVGRNRKRITIGRYPLVSLSEARARARELVAERVLGKDDLPPMTFGEAVPLFIASRYGGDYIKPRTRDETERLLNRHFVPKFRYDQLAVIKTHEIADVIDKLRKTPSIAHHAFGAIRLFFRWAEGRQYVLRSPCAILQPPSPSRPRERVLARAEIKTLLMNVREHAGTFPTIVELLLLTGQRRGEISSLRAEWIDWEKRTITFPSAITKNKRAHTLPFGPRVGELLRRGETKGLLFPAARTEGKRTFAGWSKSKGKLDRECGFPYWTLHDLRRTFATNLAALGVAVHVTEKVLNHVSGSLGGIVGVYQRHTYEKEMREAIDLWEGWIEDLMRETIVERIERARTLRVA